jgi:nicotinate-nucleotide pyrophosphorylase (carboxylating)
MNHRFGLHDQFLVKDNHLAVLARAAGIRPDEVDLREVVGRARARCPGLLVEVEASTLEGCDRALEAGVDAILLDNLDPRGLAEAVAHVRARAAALGKSAPALEASGGVRLETVRAIAETGVDRISVGALTHSARTLDVALEVEGS